jgi:hypothetical protein
MTVSIAGELLTVWTIRLGLVAYLAALAELLLSPDDRRARLWWTIGCLACWAHIGAAMHFVHHWDHAAVYADTARQTREVVGLDWGGGVYVNYLFALTWLADVAWWWLARLSRATRGSWLSWLLHGFLAFILFNATIVFKDGALRWAAIAACAALLLIAVIAARRRAILAG